AATTWLLVNIAAAFAPPSQRARATSGLPEAFMPAVTADQRKPRGRECAGEVSLTNRLYRCSRSESLPSPLQLKRTKSVSSAAYTHSITAAVGRPFRSSGQ